MPGTRKSYAPSLKGKVAIEAIKGNKTVAQITQTFRVRTIQNDQCSGEHLIRAFQKGAQTEGFRRKSGPILRTVQNYKQDDLRVAESLEGNRLALLTTCSVVSRKG